MKLLKKLSVITLVVTLATSCSMQNGFIQKRKYSKGYHVSLKRNNQAVKFEKEEISNDEMAITNEKTIEITQKGQKNADIKTVVPKIKEENNTTTSVINTLATTTKSIDDNSLGKVASHKNTQKPLYSKNKIHNRSFNPFKTNSNVSEVKETAVVNTILLYVLCFLIPWLAVGLATDWEIGKVLLNLLLTLLFVIPGIIHALIIVSRNS